MTRLDELARIMRRAMGRHTDQAHEIAKCIDRGKLPTEHRMAVYRAARDIKVIAYLMWHLEAYGVFPGRRAGVVSPEPEPSQFSGSGSAADSGVCP